jgi:threonine dehydrogenase-like Zn-dependent dehydrogenase
MVAQKSMRVLQITEAEHAEMIDMPVPEPKEAEVLVKVLAMVTCNQFDLHIYQGRPMLDETQPVLFPLPPGFPGHEWVGEVLEVGPKATHFQVGDWIVQPGGRGEGPQDFGGYAQYLVIDETCCVDVPKGMDLRKLAPLEMASCVSASILPLKAINAIEGKTAAVSGLGPAGIVAAQMLRAEGAEEVIGIEIHQPRREHALSSGVVDRVIDPLSEEGRALPVRRGGDLMRADHWAPIDVAIDCAGARASAQYLMDHTKDIVSLFGVQREPYAFEGWYVGLHQGLMLCGYPGRDPECGPYAVRKVKSGILDLSLAVSHTMPLEEYGKALELIEAQEALKVMFLPHGTA